MTVPFPTPQWPSGLLEIGPPEDRSILLRSVADIAGASYAVLAIRIDPIGMAADLRPDVAAHAYRDYQVQDMVEQLSQFAEISDQSLVALATGTYVMFMIPADSD